MPYWAFRGATGRFLGQAKQLTHCPAKGATRPGAAADATLRRAMAMKRREKGGEGMDAGNEAPAAILLQTIFLTHAHFHRLSREHANKRPVPAAQSLTASY